MMQIVQLENPALPRVFIITRLTRSFVLNSDFNYFFPFYKWTYLIQNLKQIGQGVPEL